MPKANSQLWWVDRMQRCVVRGRRTVTLTSAQFLIFMQFYPRSEKRSVIKTTELVEAMYKGVREPPLDPHNVLAVNMNAMNRKLEPLGIRFRGIKSRKNSAYQLMDMHPVHALEAEERNKHFGDD